MNERISRLLRDFDTGKISRRELLSALGLAAVSVPLVAIAAIAINSRCLSRQDMLWVENISFASLFLSDERLHRFGPRKAIQEYLRCGSRHPSP